MGVGIYRTDIDGAIKIEALDLTFPLKLRCSRHHLKFLIHLYMGAYTHRAKIVEEYIRD